MAAHHGRFGFHYDAHKDNDKWNYEGLNGTTAMKDLQQEMMAAVKKSKGEEFAIKCSFGYLYFWSDSFLRCFIKQKDNSVWILTVTICPPYSKRWSGKYTYVLAMGKSSLDHTPIIDLFYEELKVIKQGFTCYFGDDNVLRNVSFGLLFHSADRPERQTIANTRKEGTYGKVSNHSCPIHKKFCSCKKCYWKLVDGFLQEGWWAWNAEIKPWVCNVCFQWDIKTDDPNQEVYPASSNYPPITADLNTGAEKKLSSPEGRKPGQKYLGPVRLTAQFMKDACWFAYHARRLGHWTKPQLLEYLRTCNVKQSRIDHIEHTAFKDQMNKTVSVLGDIVPKIWLTGFDCFDRCRLPDLGMHGIAHNMIPEVMDFVHRLFSHWKKFTDFVTHANAILQDVALFGLSWCKLKPLPKSGWLGEDSMGFMRLMTYIYGMYFKNAKLNQENDHNVKDLKRMMSAFKSVISVLMMSPHNKGKICSNRIRAIMKLFMSALHYAQKNYGCLKSKDIITGKKKNMKQPDYVSRISIHDVLDLLDILDKEKDVSVTKSESRMQSNRHELRKIKVNMLKNLLKSNGVKDIQGKKEDLQRRLFTTLLGREPAMQVDALPSRLSPHQNQPSTQEVGRSSQEFGGSTNVESTDLISPNAEFNGRDSPGLEGSTLEENLGLQPGIAGAHSIGTDATSAQAKNGIENWVWDKGAFLSFLANIDYQMEYLTVLREIWYVIFNSIVMQDIFLKLLLSK
jgi:hypothetical protein